MCLQKEEQSFVPGKNCEWICAEDGIYAIKGCKSAALCTERNRK
jgi:hypothetical protein